MDNNNFKIKYTILFKPGFFKDQLRYCYLPDNKRIDKFQHFIFPFINKEISIQAGLNVPSAFKFDDQIKSYPFLDNEFLKLRINPNYQNAFDREEAVIRMFSVEKAVSFAVAILDYSLNIDTSWFFKGGDSEVYHPKKLGMTRKQYDKKRWDSDGYGTYIRIGEIQRILNHLYKQNIDAKNILEKKSAILIQKNWRGWYTRFKTSWNVNTRLGEFYLKKKIGEQIKNDEIFE